jgi:predicted ferric reductase
MTANLVKEPEFYESSLNVQTLLFLLLAFIEGLLLAAILLPGWLPNLAVSLMGPDPKGFWYLSRASAFVGLILLWFSMAFGLSMTNRMARLWPGGPAAFAIHEFTSLLGLGFAFFHGLILLGDHYIGYTLSQILVPFASQNYLPTWVGIGQLGFYCWAIIALSYYLRKPMGKTAWRLVHFVSFFTFAMAMLHGLTSGTDSGTVWAQGIYWCTSGSLLFLLIYRVLVSLPIRWNSAMVKVAK